MIENFPNVWLEHFDKHSIKSPFKVNKTCIKCVTLLLVYLSTKHLRINMWSVVLDLLLKPAWQSVNISLLYVIYLLFVTQKLLKAKYQIVHKEIGRQIFETMENKVLRVWRKTFWPWKIYRNLLWVMASYKVILSYYFEPFALRQSKHRHRSITPLHNT